LVTTHLWDTCYKYSFTNRPTKAPTSAPTSGPKQKRHINCGATESWLDIISGEVWFPDEYYTNGVMSNISSSECDVFDNLLPQCTYRWFPDVYGSYNIPVPDGDYAVKLYFSENYFTAADERRFNVYVNGIRQLDDIDVFEQAGGAFKYWLGVDINVTVLCQDIVIHFTRGSANNPMISDIIIELIE
jgi:Malectin domain